MAETKLGGNPVKTVGDLPPVGAAAPDFTLTGTDLGDVTKESLSGSRVVLNIFPSIDTPVCAASVRAFNERAAGLDNTVVLNVSADLPFAMTRFCGAEGIENARSASAFRSTFGEDFGVTLQEGRLAGLFARAVIILDEQGNVVYEELVEEIAQEPNYDAALDALS